MKYESNTDVGYVTRENYAEYVEKFCTEYIDEMGYALNAHHFNVRHAAVQRTCLETILRCLLCSRSIKKWELEAILDDVEEISDAVRDRDIIMTPIGVIYELLRRANERRE
ncbi:hypothetical protein lacNasYZ03_05600 [Lactobacillus nasalidis]|uniref:Uncharacterized protein n=1 Tax=Lactobacillus nasalidis TaxID=2797258 RepID=A0ABQ3W395_9LACO|nr:hypothetical protein [Lactobacillus nasalidis]GHV97346.1 hypothetical protein lacNasYZ01_05280 [Lactobacillus nasalidis]GHV99942.1 hypothetical protein lacNasYZ02_13720 [Lactobacillus nasalidis]GHW00873.1 hypothetical protein lacNasYZ03_05600 [Lactobacillus nasalidis]